MQSHARLGNGSQFNEIDLANLISSLSVNAVTSQLSQINEVAKLVVDVYSGGGKVFTFGAGHAQAFAMELASRAGGMSFYTSMHLQDFRSKIRNANWDLRDSEPERQSENGIKLLHHHQVSNKDLVIIASQSGRNKAIIEMAMECKAQNIKVIGIGSLLHASQSVSRHESGKKLMDVVDIFLNNGSVYGDATVEVPDGKKICSASTACFAIFAQVINFAVAKEMLSRGITPPVLVSANVDQGDSSNATLKREKAPPAV
jgi:uncharacterized phosphosugar-binding protein